MKNYGGKMAIKQGKSRREKKLDSVKNCMDSIGKRL